VQHISNILIGHHHAKHILHFCGDVDNSVHEFTD
jgi:hypothetical protein